MNTATAIQQINTLCDDVKRMILAKEDFLGFFILCTGIELIGNAFDNNDFKQLGNSEHRFKNALKNLFKKSWYRQNQDFLFKEFRGPLIHQYRPGEKVLLTSNTKNNFPRFKHLKKEEEKTILVLEVFYEDFLKAKEKMETLISKNDSKISILKMEKPYMSIKVYHIEGIDNSGYFPASGSTEMPMDKVQKFKSKVK